MTLTGAGAAWSLAQRVLLDELERAFDGDEGARIFVQAALRSARLSTLPVEPTALLQFVRAHLLSAVTGELGGRGAAEFLSRTTAALEQLSAPGPYDSGVVARDAWRGDGDAETDLTVEVPIHFVTTLPPNAEPSDAAVQAIVPPPSTATVGSGRVPVARLRVALVHGDRFGRVGIARHLLQANCDVTVVDSVLDLEALDATYVPVAVVHLGARDVDVLLDGLVHRNPDLRVLAIVGDEGASAGQVLLASCNVQHHHLAPADVRPADVAPIVRRLVFW